MIVWLLAVCLCMLKSGGNGRCLGLTQKTVLHNLLPCMLEFLKEVWQKGFQLRFAVQRHAAVCCM